MNRNMLHYAFEYLDRGWPVIPVKGKTPAVPWTAYQKERPSLDQVKQWFTSGENYNLAVITGTISKLVVVDCDSQDDARWWRKTHAETPLVATTGRGGSHYYYRYPKSQVGNRIGILGRKIDVRAEGGLVVAPPSIHPETNQAYQWERWDHFALDEVPVFDSSWLGRKRCFLSGSKAREFVPNIQDGISYIRHITAESGNGGHNATFRAACKLRDSGLSANEAFDALITWNETNAEPPWTEKELAHKIRDAYREGST
jgi:putative DNA primase/helicase